MGSPLSDVPTQIFRPELTLNTLCIRQSGQQLKAITKIGLLTGFVCPSEPENDEDLLSHSKHAELY